MFFCDYLFFIIQIYNYEKDKIKRIISILFTTSLAIYLILIASNYLSNKIKSTPKYILTPLSSTTNISEIDLKLIEERFPNTDISFVETVQTIELININKNTSHEFSVAYSDEIIEPIMNEEAFILNEFDSHDIFKINSLSFSNPRLDQDLITDLLLPNHFNINTKTEENLLIQINSNHDIKEIINEINSQKQLYDLSPIDNHIIFEEILSLVELFLLSLSIIFFVLSLTNINSILPYFISEFKPEINLLIHLGLKKEIIKRLFLLLVLAIITISILFSLIIYLLISFMLKLSIPLYKITLIVLIQGGTSIFIGSRSIDI